MCIYTCITGNYDKLLEPIVYDKNIDYICFTDNSRLCSKYWRILPIPAELKYLSSVKQQRIIKICPHRYLSKQYNTSIWIDGNFQIVNSLNEFIKQYDLNKYPFYVRLHPGRNCIYKEAQAVINRQKENSDIIRQQMQKYKNEGYPENIGLVETGIIIRRHNDKKCILIDNTWAEELLLNSHRDQLSFNYICWKHKFIPGYLINEFSLKKNKYFILKRHNV